MRVLLKFSKDEEVKYISHLDLLRTMQRALRRADIPMAFSQGFNPHPIMAFASALAVGATSEGEYMDIALTVEIDVHELKKKLNAVLPTGIQILEVRKVPESFPTLMSVIRKADYTIKIVLTDNQDFDIQKEVDMLLRKESIIIQKEGKNGIKQLDIRPLIDDMRVIEQEDKNIVIGMRIASGSKANLRPEQVIESLFMQSGISMDEIKYHIHRVNLYSEEAGLLVTPLTMDE